MKYLNYIVLLIPVPFLFHYYEYGQHLKHQDAPFLFIGFLFFMFLSVITSKNIKFIPLFILTIIQTLISLYLASRFIENDTYWFKPFDRDKVVLLTSVAYFLGQLIIKAIIKWVKQSQN
jgi:hypothetical protein